MMGAGSISGAAHELPAKLAAYGLGDKTWPQVDRRRK